MENKELENRINNLVSLGIEREFIEALLSQGMSIEKVEDVCNDSLNEKLDRCCRSIMSLISGSLSGYYFIAVKKEQQQANFEVVKKIKAGIIEILEKENVLLTKLDMVFNSLSSEIRSLLTDVNDALLWKKNEKVAKILGKSLYTDLTVNDIK